MKIKKGDTIKIISGKDRGKTAKVLRTYPKANLIVAEGINLKRKHVRPRSQGKKGEIVQIPAPFSASAAMLVCSNCAKPARIGVRFDDGVKVRICKKCQVSIV
ncbi:MAG: 50S ribosomal protein L24 [Candidatus Sungbacteria bacterium RIFCSPLOWO2_02_FULL_48_13b]|uniref:Large ribosomal subunit protein uL24 n=2 Tax=Candidatus Sungiibacteriota TaxID=1817917 RepID=A0A1G2LE75_9BACT|nr:MAG: 50S ribosomal protein L24 [Candidatus Sungbacteria bacterium RIFCSPHIGHO2_02_FULL_49_20]OHA09844.1 MAG: 50S ribosomal protein L24 [Candidatus Sungbacteria bacterium RIFCSPLOWO2_02_FULL_48_13b]